MASPPDRFDAARAIASAQARLARALETELRAHKAERLPRKQTARPAGAKLADQLARLQQCATELALWADRAQAERLAAASERERGEGEAARALGAVAASAERGVEELRTLEALHAELDGLPTRLHPKYAALAARAEALRQEIAAAALRRDQLGEAAERARAGIAGARELEQALERSEQTLRRLERVAARAADQVAGMLATHAPQAGAQALARALAEAVKEVDRDAVEAMTRETLRFLSRASGRVP